ncbi:profilin, required for normal timing of actin polymerization in response to thermal stress [Podila minutissima]|uniref:Profilin n=1 Tax=Podila minutissima TaxID=64525 RepID=A0A9P5VKI7_9FUNG|nr:profilin, required for normal timing of actin polymerization in response to thermal stress [Podila minutissima]
MSWQDYVKDNLIGSGDVSQAAIIGLDGSEWATSAGFQVVGAEAQKVVSAFGDSRDPKSPGYAGALEAAANGIYINGKKYVVFRTSEATVQARLGATGVHCVKTNMCILIGYYDENIQANKCSLTVEKLGDYLRGVGY